MTSPRRAKRATPRTEIEARDQRRRSKAASPGRSKATDPTLPPSKHAQRTRQLAGGLRASLNRRQTKGVR